MQESGKTAPRRAPKQERARQTVEAVLEAVRHVSRRHGAGAITTNRIAVAAGVSIGSLYQYFPDKQAIFAALHDRHVDGVKRVIERTMAQCASAPFEAFTGELVEGLADVHLHEAELHEIVSIPAPAGADGFKDALHAAFEKVMSPARQDRYTLEETDRMLSILPPMVETLVHGVARPKQAISRAKAKDEAMRTIAFYLDSVRDARPGRY